MEIKTVGFVGLGVMGRSMASNLMKAGFDLVVYNRTKASAQPIVERGAKWCDTPAEVMSQSDALITIVGYPKDVEQVYFGENGVFSGFAAGKLVIDMTTSSPILAKKIGEKAAALGGAALDAPVSGGDTGARNGTLTIMVGGERDAFDRAVPLFAAMGKEWKLQGTWGAGQHTKMANQIAIACNMMGVCEALHYAKMGGLDPELVLASIAGGAAGSYSLSNLGPRMLKGDFAPGFYVKHFIKDMRIALECAAEMKIELPGLELANKLYHKLSEQGGDNFGTQALYKLYIGQ